MGRFPAHLRTHLKDNDVEKVVRNVVLHKKSEHKETITNLITKNTGEISRQLNTTKIASFPADREAYVPDFPLLPVRRRFWRQVLQHTDSTGTTAQMRTQLRVTHDACKSVADRPVGAIIPGDFLYDQLATDLISSGQLPKRFYEIIEEQRTLKDGELRSRICALIFLINKLPETEGDLGIRANADHLCDLLTDSLTEALYRQAESASLPVANQARTDLDAVTASRNLLDDPCPVSSILGELGTALRQKVREAHRNYEATIQNEQTRLEGNATWLALDPAKRESLLQNQGVRSHAEPIVGSEAELQRALQSCDLRQWETKVAALSQLCDQALTQAIKASEPKAQRVQLPSATIKSAEDLDAWLAASREKIEKALQVGPVIL